MYNLETRKEIFDSEHYIVAKGLIPLWVIEDLKNFYYKNRSNFKKENIRKFLNEHYREQKPGLFKPLDYIHESLTPRVSAYIGHPLITTYNTGRAYLRGSEMVSHRDRAQCDISLTMTVVNDGDNWPIYFKSVQGKEVPLKTEPGDCIIYKGTDIFHWRDPNENDFQIQHFFHWISKDTRTGSWMSEFSREEIEDFNTWPGNLETMTQYNQMPLPKRVANKQD